MIEELFKNYHQWKENLPSRYFPPSMVEELLLRYKYNYDVIGYSFENRPIYNLRIGKSKCKILLWSQMHGNESTATRAMFDFWKLLHESSNLNNHITDDVEIHFIPQLNPDGAFRYQRRNAVSIDINRDFIAEQSPEIRVLKKQVTSEKYNFLFNLHDQRSIFHPRGQQLPATLSFLAPVIDDQNTKVNQRELAKKVISDIIKALNNHIPNQLAKFSEEYYPRATGDNFQKLGYPTVLIESGHFPKDYHREQSRKFTCLAIMTAIESIAKQNYLTSDVVNYDSLPFNDKQFYDIIYRDVVIKSNSKKCVVDIALQFEELLDEQNSDISFKAKIVEIGDLSDFNGHDNYHAENRIFKSGTHYAPEIGNSGNFELGDWIIQNGKLI